MQVVPATVNEKTYLTTDELSDRIKYDVRTIRERLKDSVLLEGVHYFHAATVELIEAMRVNGYQICVEGINCEVEEAQRRNLARGEDNISCNYAEPFQRRWLLDGARKQSQSVLVSG
jgi:hypothetical protein